MEYLLPDAARLSEIVPMLFSEGCDVAEAAGLSEEEKQYVAVYLDDDDDLAALCYCDTGFAFGAGGALSMLPVDLVNEEKQSGELTEMMYGNLYEVMNILSSQFMDETTSHLRLAELKKAEDLDDVANGNVNTATFDVHIKGYGHGKLGFCIPG